MEASGVQADCPPLTAWPSKLLKELLFFTRRFLNDPSLPRPVDACGLSRSLLLLPFDGHFKLLVANVGSAKRGFLYFFAERWSCRAHGRPPSRSPALPTSRFVFFFFAP